MKKANSKIIRIPTEKGNFSTISNNILMKNNISSDAKILLTLLLNNSDNWNVNLQYYSDKFKWNGAKQAKVIKEMKDNGYLVVTKFSKGNRNGFDYFYTISEYGSLESNKEKTSQTTNIETSIPISNFKNDDEAINQYMANVKGLIDEYSRSFTISESFYDEIHDLFKEILVGEDPIDATKFNEPKVRNFILDYIINDKINWITFMIDKQKTSLHGTQANQKKFITETPKYFKRLFDSGKYINDNDIVMKLTNQKYSILGFGAKNLPDYMD